AESDSADGEGRPWGELRAEPGTTIRLAAAAQASRFLQKRASGQNGAPGVTSELARGGIGDQSARPHGSVCCGSSSSRRAGAAGAAATLGGLVGGLGGRCAGVLYAGVGRVRAPRHRSGV